MPRGTLGRLFCEQVPARLWDALRDLPDVRQVLRLRTNVDDVLCREHDVLVGFTNLGLGVDTAVLRCRADLVLVLGVLSVGGSRHTEDLRHDPSGVATIVAVCRCDEAGEFRERCGWHHLVHAPVGVVLAGRGLNDCTRRQAELARVAGVCVCVDDLAERSVLCGAALFAVVESGREVHVLVLAQFDVAANELSLSRPLHPTVRGVLCAEVGDERCPAGSLTVCEFKDVQDVSPVCSCEMVWFLV